MIGKDPYIGRIFGNYRIVSRISCGSFGCVYRARHSILPRSSAIKLLHAAYLQSIEEKKRFLWEARFLEALDHPHILKMYDVGIDNGFPYLVTEFASHGSLRERLSKQPKRLLPLEETITILTQVGQALYYAHQRNIIHHDLKPANILFNSTDQVLLADFGIAIVQTKTTMRRPTAAIGTPAYMAPELFKGEVGHRSDQYSLGCIAYELATGRLPFIAPNNAAIGIMHLQEEPTPPKHFNPHLPLHIEQAILKAMSKQSVNRYDDVQAFIMALHSPNLTEEQWLNNALKLRELKRYEEALVDYNQALQINPNYIDAHKGKGQTLYELKHYEEALAAYERATQLAPEDANAWSSKANLLFKLKSFKQALVAYARAIQLDPENAFYHYDIGHALKFLGWFEESQKAYNKALQLCDEKEQV